MDLEYKPAFFLRNAHLQTIVPSVFRKVKDVNYQRERITTPDHDFLDLDWSFFANGQIQNSNVSKRQPLVIISHGLEGSSDRQYVTGMVKIFNQNGYDSLAWNFRSCSGHTNKQLRFYHSGATDDLDLVIKNAIHKGYSSIYLIGFSLGGNLTLKYLGEKHHYPEIKKAVVFSVPLHLSNSSKKIAEPENILYTLRFLKSLKKKLKAKATVYPNELNLANLGKIKTVKQFDDAFTSKLHGFINAEDYYAKNSSIIFVKKIKVPTLIINAKNDPFLSDDCYPVELLANHEFVQLEIPDQGGHCGFWQKGYKNFLWSELRALDFIGKLN